MKTVKEIKEAKAAEVTCDGDQDDLNQFVLDALIGITEHLTAQQLAIPRAFGPLINPDDERRGMIAALRWVKRDHALDVLVQMSIDNAIARIENGGDL